jgi:hypothetical protein
MTRSPLFWIAVGVVGVWGYHHFVSPLPGAKSAS